MIITAPNIISFVLSLIFLSPDNEITSFYPHYQKFATLV